MSAQRPCDGSGAGASGVIDHHDEEAAFRLGLFGGVHAAERWRGPAQAAVHREEAAERQSPKDVLRFMFLHPLLKGGMMAQAPLFVTRRAPRG